MIRRLLIDEFVLFMLFAIAMFAALLSGAVAWLFDTLPTKVVAMDPGNAAEWVAGLGTIGVALAALLTSRRATQVAEDTHAIQLRAEAAKVTWWLEPEFYPTTDSTNGASRFPTPGDLYEVEVGDPVEHRRSYYIVVHIENGTTGVIGEVTMMMGSAEDVSEYSAGEHFIGLIRPGPNRYWAFLQMVGASEGAWTSDRRRLNRNQYGKWLDFTDTTGHKWRRHADGTLEHVADPSR